MRVSAARALGAVHGIPVLDGVTAGVRRVHESVCAVHQPVAVPVADATLEMVMASPVLFEVIVADPAFTSRSAWRHLGVAELSPDERLRRFVFARTDALTDRVQEYVVGMTPAENDRARQLSTDEAERLEDLAVWSAVHVERRLKARLEGREQGFLSTMLRPWQAKERRERVLAGLEPSRPPEGLVMERLPDWG